MSTRCPDCESLRKRAEAAEAKWARTHEEWEGLRLAYSKLERRIAEAERARDAAEKRADETLDRITASVQFAHDSAHHALELHRAMGTKRADAVVNHLCDMWRDRLRIEAERDELRVQLEQSRAIAAGRIMDLEEQLAAATTAASRASEAHDRDVKALQSLLAAATAGEVRTTYAVEHVGKEPSEWVNVSFFGTNDIGAAKTVRNTWQEIKGKARIIEVTERRRVVSGGEGEAGNG